MPNVGIIDILFRTQTSEFGKGVDYCTGKLQGFGKTYNSLLEGFAGGIAGGIVGGAILGGIQTTIDMVKGAATSAINLVKEQMAAIDNIAKTSDRLDIATESLVRFHHAADLAGVQSGDFDSMLEKMSANIGETVMHGGKLDDTFQMLGLDVRELAKMKPDEQFLRIVAAMDQIKNASQRMAVAKEIFGKSGAQMLNVMHLDELKQAGDLADRMGLSLSRMDAKQVEQANDAWTNMTAALKGCATEFAVFISPMATATLDWIREQIILVKQLADGYFDLERKVAKYLSTNAGNIGRSFKGQDFGREQEKTAAAFEKFQKQHGAEVAKMKADEAANVPFKEKPRSDNYWKNNELVKLSQSLFSPQENYQSMANGLNDAYVAGLSLEDTMRGILKAREALFNSQSSYMSPFDKGNAELDLYREKLKLGIITQEQFNVKQHQLNEAYRGSFQYASPIEKAQQQFEKLKELKALGGNFLDSHQFDVGHAQANEALFESTREGMSVFEEYHKKLEVTREKMQAYGFTAEQIARVQMRMQHEFDNSHSGSLSEYEQYQQKIQQLKEKFAAGDISNKEFNHGVFDAEKQLASQFGQESQRPALVQRGSAGEYEAFARQLNPQQRSLDGILAEARRQSELQERMAEKAGNRELVVAQF